jgi:hypothetical protein
MECEATISNNGWVLVLDGGRKNNFRATEESARYIYIYIILNTMGTQLCE